MRYSKFLLITLILLACVGSANAALSDALEDFYDFNNNQFTSNTSSCTATNSGTTNAPGIINDSRRGSGTAQRVDLCTTQIDNAHDFSISAWIFGESNSNGQTVLNKGATLYWVTSGGNLEIQYFDSSGPSWRSCGAITSPTSTWNHIVMVWDESESNMTCYNNASVIGSSKAYNMNFATNAFSLGCEGGSNTACANYRFDNLGIWNRTLTEAEIADLYNNGNSCEFSCVNASGGGGGGSSEKGNSSIIQPSRTNETQSVNFKLNLTGWNVTAFMPVNLTINGTVYTNADNVSWSGDPNLQNQVYNVSVRLPLVASNNTFFVANWTWVAHFQNGSNTSYSVNASIGVYHAYFADVISLDSSPLETTYQGLNVSAINNLNETNITGKVFFNGTEITSSGNNTFYNGTTFIPLLANNDTYYSVSTDYTVVWGEYNYTRSKNTSLRAIYAYYITSLDYDSAVLEEYDFNTTININVGVVNANLTLASIYYNNTDFNGTFSSDNTSANVLMTSPSLPLGVSNVTLSLLANISVQYGANTFTRNFTVQYQTVSQFDLYNCSETSAFNKSLTLRLFHDELLTQNIGTVDVTFEVWQQNRNNSKNFSFGFSGASNYTICLFPQDTNVTTEAQFQYQGNDFALRNYWLINALLSNTSQTVDLFMINSSKSTDTILDINDENDDPIEGEFIKVLKYYIDEGIHRTVEICKTDSNGQCLIRVEHDNPFYMLVFEKDNIENSRTVDFQFTTSTLFFTINLLDSFITTFNQLDSISNSLVYDNITGNATFSFSDTSGVSQQGCLRVTKDTGWGRQLLVDKCVSSSTGIISENIGTNVTDTMTLQGSFVSNDGSKESVVAFLVIDGPGNVAVFGQIGLLLGFFFAGSMTLLGVAAGGLIGGIASFLATIFIVNIVGLWTLSGTAMTIILAFGLVLAARMKL